MKAFPFVFLTTLSLCALYGCSNKDTASDSGNGTTTEAGNALSFRLTDTAGTSLPGAIAMLCETSATTPCANPAATDTSDATGQIAFPEVEKGEYVVFVSYGEQTMSISVNMSGTSDEALGEIPFQDGSRITPPASSLLYGEYWSDTVGGWHKYLFFESESIVHLKDYLHNCLVAEGRIHWKWRNDSLQITLDSTTLFMGRVYQFDAADSAVACQQEYKEMKVTGTKLYSFVWIDEPTSFRINYSTLHFGRDSLVPPDTTWDLKTFTRTE